MLNLFQYFFPKRPSFVDEILTGADQTRARKFYDRCPNKHGFVISVDPRNLSWAEEICWGFDDDEMTEEELGDHPRFLHFYAKPWRVKNNDWMLAYDMEDEMSSFVYDETTQEVVYLTAGWGKERNTILFKQFEKVFGSKPDGDLIPEERTVIASSFGRFLRSNRKRRSDMNGRHAYITIGTGGEL